MSDEQHECPWEGCNYSHERWRIVKVHHNNAHKESIAGESGSEHPWQNGELLVELYIHQGLSKGDLAERWDCSEMTIYRWLKRALSDTPYGHACPKCGEVFPTDRGMRQHYGQSHEGSIAGHPVECMHCGKVERLPESQVRRADRNFCSEDCRIDWLQEAGRTESECAYCGNSLSRPRWQVEVSERQFCNNTCHGAWAREYGPRGPKHHSYKPRDEVECVYCGVVNERRVSYPDVSNTFCDLDCYGSWISETGVRTGENSPTWAGGYANYGKGWNEAKKESVRERDDRKCQHCGRTEEEHIEKFGGRHVVHHIQKARSFDDPEKRNHEDNLITLCRGECHRIWEQMSPLRPDMATPAND